MKLELPKWHKDLSIYENTKTTYIIEGNVNDLQAWVFPDSNASEPISLNDYLYRYLNHRGYDIIVFYNKIDGFHNPFSKQDLKYFFERAKTDPQTCKTFDSATRAMRSALGSIDMSVALVFDMANTALSSPEHLSEQELEQFANLFLASKTRKEAISRKNGKLLTNLMFYVVEKVNDLPVWFYINNPYVKNLSISKPNKSTRKNFITSNMGVFHDFDSLDQDELEKTIDEISVLTEGFSNIDVFGLLSLCEQDNLSVKDARKAISSFKYGETISYWDELDRDKIENAGARLHARVKGQPRALSKVVDIISRACSGMSGIQSSAIGRPKGVLFFAGPTGTGKTELAKAIASEVLFGDESFVIRFDMSEYQQSHSDQKLLGAPPGYIGYGAGGQLTNAVKENPFSILLFDEIDKAHPSILDKFLQILEDGRMTDSTGETVYFSESLIIFTSNLGMVDTDIQKGFRYQNITMDMEFDEIERRVLASIKNFFTFDIGRPELLNRIGNNFVVFDFIREEIVPDILSQQIEKITENLEQDKSLTLKIGQEFYQRLLEAALENRINGGRGIVNVVESELINPLSRIIFLEQPPAESIVEILGLNEDGTLDVHFR